MCHMEELLCVQNELKCPQLPNTAPVCRTSECSQQRPNQSSGEGWSITWLTSHWGFKSPSWALDPIAVWGLWMSEIRDSVSSTACWQACLSGHPRGAMCDTPCSHTAHWCDCTPPNCPFAQKGQRAHPGTMSALLLCPQNRNQCTNDNVF